jgi:hypothetical protein
MMKIIRRLFCECDVVVVGDVSVYDIWQARYRYRVVDFNRQDSGLGTQERRG